MQIAKECYVCKATIPLEYHHVFFGGRNRKKSDEDGLVVTLCPAHHRGTDGVHGKNGHSLDLKLKQEAQKIWMEYYGKTEDEFRTRYGKNYL